MTGQPLEAERGSAVDSISAALGPQGRRARAGGYHYAPPSLKHITIGRMNLHAGTQRGFRSDKLHSPQLRCDTLTQGVDHCLHATAGGIVVERHIRATDTKLTGAAARTQYIGARRKAFGGYASAVETRAPYPVALDQRHALACCSKSGGHLVAAGACAYHDGIKLPHRTNPCK